MEDSKDLNEGSAQHSEKTAIHSVCLCVAVCAQVYMHMHFYSLRLWNLTGAMAFSSSKLYKTFHTTFHFKIPSHSSLHFRVTSTLWKIIDFLQKRNLIFSDHIELEQNYKAGTLEELLPNIQAYSSRVKVIF